MAPFFGPALEVSLIGPGPIALSVWRPLPVLVGLTLLLSACVAGYGAGRKAQVLGGSMQVGLAAGYCIDNTSSREGNDSLVLLMGRCNTGVTESPALLTLSVGPAGSGAGIGQDNAALAAFFTSDAGRAMLSRDGRARDVEVVQAFDQDGVLTMQVRDLAVGDYWRAVAAIRGRLVTLSVAGTEEAPLDSAAGKQLLARAMAELVKANPAPRG
ncbi:MAG: hypothetical protein CFE30_09370 [Bradyrhizobium sp. PARBB1]|nr:MAG: hypothetical protein CFE30_09370 [Bradyrhizobium sp. PARBB1]